MELNDKLVDLYLNAENLQTAEDEFAKINISLRDCTGNFRSMWDILKDCAEAFQKISKYDFPQEEESHD